MVLVPVPADGHDAAAGGRVAALQADLIVAIHRADRRLADDVVRGAFLDATVPMMPLRALAMNPTMRTRK
jgi:hypothetical protein